MRRSAIRLVLALATLTALAAACGDDGEASGDIEATASDFQFDPDSWSVPAGEEFTIDFTNDGSVEHEWAVLTESIESEDEFAEDIVLLEVEAIPAGESTTESFTIDEAGTYQVICAIETHFDAGMEGELTVE
jgi:plastocyanin